MFSILQRNRFFVMICSLWHHGACLLCCQDMMEVRQAHFLLPTCAHYPALAPVFALACLSPALSKYEQARAKNIES
eukprot:SAG31_NODE_1012_length_10379_cov_3.699319_9_plen_76_part_00